MDKKYFYVYILKCSDGTLYTGYTVDLDNRIKKHNLGKASKYTRIRRPVQMIYYEEYDCKSSALKRESEIKRMKREDKVKLIHTLQRASQGGSI